MPVWTHDAATVRKAELLILGGRSEVVYRWLKSRPGDPADERALIFLKDVFVLLLRQNAQSAILAAALKAPVDELFAVVPSYFAACVFLHRRQFETGFALLDAFRNRCLENLEYLPTEDADGFMVLFRHALLLSDDRYLEAHYYQDHRAINEAKLDQIHWVTLPPDASSEGAIETQPIILVTCDQKYAELFLARFLESIDSFCSDRLIHIHLIDPNEEPPRLEALPFLTRNRVALTWERSGELKCSAYYASARFVWMGEWLRYYRQQIMTFDVDVTLKHPVELIDQAMGDADFGCFRWDYPSPCSAYLATVTVFAPTDAGREFATLVRNLILSKMSLKRPLLWLIDQAALYSAIYVLSEKAGRLRLSDFTQRIGIQHIDFLEFCDPKIDKLGLMKQASSVGEEDEHTMNGNHS